MTYENIIVQAEDVWKTAQSEWAQLRTHLKKIAENPEFGVVIYLTVDNELVQILVYVDDNELYSEQCVSELDCKTTARKIYGEYLSEKVLDKFFGEEEEEEGLDDEEYTRYEEESEMEEREAEIDCAVIDFLTTILEADLDKFVDDADMIYEDCKEHFLEYLNRKWGFEIRRPMYLEDENGEEFYEEYPYECMEFEDEDNPIYK